MTVPAARTGSPARGFGTSITSPRALRALALSILSVSSTPAAAQVGAAVSIFSDYRFRGFSISESRPVAVLDLSYDTPAGLYAGASGSVVQERGKVLHTLGLQVNGGYARRLNSGLTIDVGALHSTYSSYSGLSSARSYTELYAGLGGRLLSTRVSVSPDYFGTGWTVRGEVSGQLSPARSLHVTGAVGLLHPLGVEQGYGQQADARIGADWTSRRWSLHAAATARAGRNFYPIRPSSRAALVVGASYAL